eukprot:1563549-Lingulodinium_polyedra.AAC.1
MHEPGVEHGVRGADDAQATWGHRAAGASSPPQSCSSSTRHCARRSRPAMQRSTATARPSRTLPSSRCRRSPSAGVVARHPAALAHASRRAPGTRA